MTSRLESNELSTLRAGYRRDVLRKAAAGTVSQLYPAGGPYVGAFVDAMYAESPLSPRDRERCLISLLAVRGEERTLAAHVYWGLMEGLEPDEIAQTLLLTGGYMGMPVYATAMMTVQKLNGVLREACAANEIDSPSIVRRIFTAFA